jgi:hypothetical protein
VREATTPLAGPTSLPCLPSPASPSPGPGREEHGAGGGTLGVYWRLRPAVPGAGGDWVDAIDLHDGRLAICVGDAAGSDPRAAAFALRVRGLLCQALLAGRGPTRRSAALSTSSPPAVIWGRCSQPSSSRSRIR